MKKKQLQQYSLVAIHKLFQNFIQKAEKDALTSADFHYDHPKSQAPGQTPPCTGKINPVPMLRQSVKLAQVKPLQLSQCTKSGYG